MATSRLSLLPRSHAASQRVDTISIMENGGRPNNRANAALLIIVPDRAVWAECSDWICQGATHNPMRHLHRNA
jgi:hypothetical protein